MVREVIDFINKLNFDDLFIIDDCKGKEYSYTDVFSQALAAANYLNDVVKGDSVIAVKENSYELALLYFAVMLTSKRIVVADPQKGRNEIKTIVDGIETTGIFLDSQDVRSISDKHYVLNLPESAKTNINSSELRQEIIQRISSRNTDTPYLVTFTSGTSGVSKGVEHSLDNFFRTALALDNKVNKRGGYFLHFMPMTYMAGIFNSLIYPFLTGYKIVITSRFSVIMARSFWDKAAKYNVDLFWLSPSMLMMIDQLDRTKIGEEFCRKIKPTFLVGTAPLSNEMRNRFNARYGIKVFASYGLSETPILSIETIDSIGKSDKNSVGELLNGVEYEITKEGELLVDAPWMFLRYTNENTEQYFSGRFYKSGDLVNIKMNYLYITGRIKDLIIKGGMNISPVTIENVINKNPEISESVVFGVTDSSGEERICCAYVTRSGAVDDSDGLDTVLKRAVIEELGRNYLVDYMWRINEIPRNINGKIDRKIIRRSWEKMNKNSVHS